MRYKPKPVRAETLHITLASSKQIQRWAERRLSNGSIIGEVTMIDTVRQKNLKPTRDGLFCERIFGPVEDFVCSCGKYHSPPSHLRYCPDCEVDIVSSKIRRYRLGYIKLKSLVVHSWFYREPHQNPLLHLLESENKKLLELFVYCLSKFKSLHSFQAKKHPSSRQRGDHTTHRIGRVGLKDLPPPLSSQVGRHEWSLSTPGYSMGSGLRSPSRSRWGFAHRVGHLLSNPLSQGRAHQPQLLREDWIKAGAGRYKKVAGRQKRARWKETGWKPSSSPLLPVLANKQRVGKAPRLLTLPSVYRLKREKGCLLSDCSDARLKTSNHKSDRSCLQASRRRRASVGKQTRAGLRVECFDTGFTRIPKAIKRLRKATGTPLHPLSAALRLESKSKEGEHTAVVCCAFLQRARQREPRAVQLFSWRNPAGVGMPLRHTLLLVNNSTASKAIPCLQTNNGEKGAAINRPMLAATQHKRVKTLPSMRAPFSFVTAVSAPKLTNWLTYSQPLPTAGFNSCLQTNKGGKREGSDTGWGQQQPVFANKQMFAQRGWFCCVVSRVAAFTIQQPIGWHTRARLIDFTLSTGRNSPSVRALAPILGFQSKRGERSRPHLATPVSLQTLDQKADKSSLARWEMARAGRRASRVKNPYLLATTACQQEGCLLVCLFACLQTGTSRRKQTRVLFPIKEGANVGLTKGFGQLYDHQEKGEKGRNPSLLSSHSIPAYKNGEGGPASHTTQYRKVGRDWKVAASAVEIKNRAEVDRLTCCYPSSFDQATSKEWLPTQVWIPLLLAGNPTEAVQPEPEQRRSFLSVLSALSDSREVCKTFAEQQAKPGWSAGTEMYRGPAETLLNRGLKGTNLMRRSVSFRSPSLPKKKGSPPMRGRGKRSVTASAANRWDGEEWKGSHTQLPLTSYYDTTLKRRLFQSALLLFWDVIFTSWPWLAATALLPPPILTPSPVRWMAGIDGKERGLFALSQVCLLASNPKSLGNVTGSLFTNTGKWPSRLLWVGGSQMVSSKVGCSREQLALFVSRHGFPSGLSPLPSIEPHVKPPHLCHLFYLLIGLRVKSRSDYSCLQTNNPSQGRGLIQGQPSDAAYKKSWISRWNHEVLRQTGPLACFLALSGQQTLKLPHRLRLSLRSLYGVCAKISRLLLLLTATSSIEKKELRRRRIALKKQLVVRSQYLLRLKLAASLPNIASKKMTPNTLPRMFLSALPVLPPALRPIITIDDQVAVADANRLYQSVLNRNIRLWATPDILFGQCVLQESVDNLIGSVGRSPLGPPAGVDINRRPLKSLSEVLKGKKGRFRQNLLGKRVDYSGRSVIVVGPTLKVHECGLPKEMVIELFQPFIIRTVMRVFGVESIFEAKMLLENDRPLLWLLIEQVLTKYPVFLNRAPTLHRLGIQAFQPKLVEGRAVLLHPLVCAAFNADFDGDQMAVHVPLSVESRSESWTILWSRFHLLSPATGEPSMLPTQDMVLGCYYLTTPNPHSQPGGVRLFASVHDALRACYQGVVAVHQPVWVEMAASFETGCDLEEVEEVRITPHGGTVEIYHSLQCRFGGSGERVSRAVRTTPGRAIINMVLGLQR